MLDRMDIAILAAIQKKGDATNSELSHMVNLSPTQCARRVNRLRHDGFISKYTAVLDREKIGFQVLAFTHFSVGAHSEQKNITFREFVRNSPEILECHTTTGGSDYILKIVAFDLEYLGNYLDRLVKVIEGTDVKSSIVLKTIKETRELPVALVGWTSPKVPLTSF